MKESKSILFKTADLERAQIDSSGRLLIGTSTNTFTGVGSSRLQISGTGADTAGAALIRTSNDGGGAYLQFIKIEVVPHNQEIIVVRLLGWVMTVLM